MKIRFHKEVITLSTVQSGVEGVYEVDKAALILS
jgi:hypothetical protein